MRFSTLLFFALVAFATATPRLRRNVNSYGGQGQAPAHTETPTGEKEAPAEQAASGEEATPVEQAASGEEATPVEQAASGKEATPAEPVVERQCPVI